MEFTMIYFGILFEVIGKIGETMFPFGWMVLGMLTFMGILSLPMEKIFRKETNFDKAMKKLEVEEEKVKNERIEKEAFEMAMRKKWLP